MRRQSDFDASPDDQILLLSTVNLTKWTSIDPAAPIMRAPAIGLMLSYLLRMQRLRIPPFVRFSPEFGSAIRLPILRSTKLVWRRACFFESQGSAGAERNMARVGVRRAGLWVCMGIKKNFALDGFFDPRQEIEYRIRYTLSRGLPAAAFRRGNSGTDIQQNR